MKEYEIVCKYWDGNNFTNVDTVDWSDRDIKAAEYIQNIEDNIEGGWDFDNDYFAKPSHRWKDIKVMIVKHDYENETSEGIDWAWVSDVLGKS